METLKFPQISPDPTNFPRPAVAPVAPVATKIKKTDLTLFVKYIFNIFK